MKEVKHLLGAFVSDLIALHLTQQTITSNTIWKVCKNIKLDQKSHKKKCSFLNFKIKNNTFNYYSTQALYCIL